MDSRVLQTQKWLNETYGKVSGFPPVIEDGITGHSTFKALIYALQVEIGVSSPDGILGNDTLAKCPTLRESANPNEETPSNLIYILQGSLWCKGISPGGFTGVFGPATANAIYKFQVAAGIETDKIVKPYILKGIMNTDAYTFSATEDIFDTYKHNVQKGLNQYYGDKIGLVAPSGIWERTCQKNLIKAAQIEWGADVDGIFGDDTINKAPTLSRNTSGYKNSKRILQWALIINGFYPGEPDGSFGTNTYNAVNTFQDFVCLSPDGVCGKQTWSSLLSSRGDMNRTATALDTSRILSATVAAAMYNDGYRDIGRYLTNASGGSLNKALTKEELSVIKKAGLNVFPIFQTRGSSAEYFTAHQGIADARTAIEAARSFGFPQSATIYFAVDYDVLIADVEEHIVPYFKNVKEQVGNLFKIGAYGPRYILTKLSVMELITSSFVADMSSGFTCNIGQKMPENWAYDQFYEVEGEKSQYPNNTGYDKCIASLRRTATSPEEYTTYTEEVFPPLSSPDLKVFEKLYNYAYAYLQSLSTPYNGFIPTVLEANKIVLAYLRQRNYAGSQWGLIAGAIETGFNTYLEQNHSDELQELEPDSIYIVDPFMNKNIEVSHFAATLGALIFYVAIIDTALDKYVDAFAGWAGDLMQVGGIIGTSMELGGENYFLDSAILYKCFAYVEGELSDYSFLELDKNGEVKSTTNSGFDYDDWIQDVDAYNMAHLYSFNIMPIHVIMDNYYNISHSVDCRYTTFKELLCKEFKKDSLFEVAKMFACLEKLPAKALNFAFEKKFGSFNNNLYGELLAKAFSDKVDYFLSTEQEEEK